MIQHIEGFHLNELSDVGFKNLCKYIAKKNLIAYSSLPSFDDFRSLVSQQVQGRLLLDIGTLLEFIDERVPEGSYDLKRNASRTAWGFDHEATQLNSSRPSELITVLWNISKGFLEKGEKIK